METKYHSFYCYLQAGNPVILEQEPQDFDELPYSYTTYCPNSEIAEMTYRTNLKIMNWRSNTYQFIK